jgi:hypothetical protein
MDYKEKNMEFGKLFFMGFTPRNIRIELISSYISELEAEKTKLEQIRVSAQDSEAAVVGYADYLEGNGTSHQFAEMLHSKSVIESMRDIALFQYATLELTIARLDFEISWFKQFKNRLELMQAEKAK